MKAKPTIWTFIYDLEIFGGIVGFVVGDFHEDPANAVAKELQMPPLDWTTTENAYGVCWAPPQHGKALIWLSNKGKLADKFDVMIHEISHAVDHMMDHYGYEDTEVRARVTGYLCKRLLEDTKNLSMRGIKPAKSKKIK